MKKLIIIGFTGLITLLLVSCDKDPLRNSGTFRISFQVSAGNTEVGDASTTYQNILGDAYQLEGLKFYLSDLVLTDTDGEAFMVEDSWFFDVLGNELSVEIEVPEGDYQGVKLGFGVPSPRNLGNPAEYDPDQPLSIRRGMHWSWAMGYIFVKFDGRIDSAGDGSFAKGLVYHTGTEGLYKEREFNEEPFSVSEGETLDFRMDLDVNKMFYSATDTIDMKVSAVTHTSTPGSDKYILANKVMENFVNEALSKTPF